MLPSDGPFRACKGTVPSLPQGPSVGFLVGCSDCGTGCSDVATSRVSGGGKGPSGRGFHKGPTITVGVPIAARPSRILIAGTADSVWSLNGPLHRGHRAAG
jgi:hypothetical protein